MYIPKSNSTLLDRDAEEGNRATRWEMEGPFDGCSYGGIDLVGPGYWNQRDAILSR